MLVWAALILVVAAGGAGTSRSLPVAQAARAPKAAATPSPAAPATVTIGWAGDVVLGSRHGNPPDGGRGLLAGVRPVLRRPDVMIGNLEGVIGTTGVAKCPLGTPNCFAFQAPPVAAETLRRAGFDVMNLANNHAHDYGEGGLAETTTHLGAARVGHTGLGAEITVVRRSGVRVAILGFAAYPWAARLDDIPAARRLVRRANRAADVVVVTMHAGGEGTGQLHTPFGDEVAFGENRGDTRAFAHAVVDAGADAVFGSDPRHPRRRAAPWPPHRLLDRQPGGVPHLPDHGCARPERDRRGPARRPRAPAVGPLDARPDPPPGRPVIDREARESTALGARLSLEDFSLPGLRPDGRIAAAAILP